MRRTHLLIALPLLFPLTGCLIAAAAGTAFGIVKYDNNEAIQDFDAPVGRVWKATVQALEGRGYDLPGGVSPNLAESEDTAEIDGEGYWVKVEELVGGKARVRVRIGTFESDENERKAGLLFESIAGRL